MLIIDSERYLWPSAAFSRFARLSPSHTGMMNNSWFNLKTQVQVSQIPLQLCFNVFNQLAVKCCYSEIQNHRGESTLGQKISKTPLSTFVSLYKNSFRQQGVDGSTESGSRIAETSCMCYRIAEKYIYTTKDNFPASSSKKQEVVVKYQDILRT